ncbi:unnamed protein product [Boreogadus saida]
MQPSCSYFTKTSSDNGGRHTRIQGSLRTTDHELGFAFCGTRVWPPDSVTLCSRLFNHSPPVESRMRFVKIFLTVLVAVDSDPAIMGRAWVEVVCALLPVACGGAFGAKAYSAVFLLTWLLPVGRACAVFLEPIRFLVQNHLCQNEFGLACQPTSAVPFRTIPEACCAGGLIRADSDEQRQAPARAASSRAMEETAIHILHSVCTRRHQEQEEPQAHLTAEPTSSLELFGLQVRYGKTHLLEKQRQQTDGEPLARSGLREGPRHPAAPPSAAGVGERRG